MEKMRLREIENSQSLPLVTPKPMDLITLSLDGNIHQRQTFWTGFSI